MKQNYINHIAMVLDASTSMTGLKNQLIQVADQQIRHLAARSKELDQETRATVYQFSDKCECLYYDKDVLRIPSIAETYKVGGYTALLDATAQAISDLGQSPQLYGDHAFLLYVLTDGEENMSRNVSAQSLAYRIAHLPENWTVAVFVPHSGGKFEAKKFGFAADNIAVWDATSGAGVTEMGKTMTATTDNFMASRSLGVRGYKNLFTTNDVNATVISKATNVAKLHPGQYRLAEVKQKCRIDEFVERLTKRAYRMGEGYYELVKTEKVQPQKNVIIRQKKGGAVFSGPDARTILGLPDHEVKVGPQYNDEYEIYVQSTSVNRNLIPGQKLIIMS